MFANATGLTAIPLLNWSKVTQLATSNYDNPFQNDSKIQSFGGFINLGKAFGTTSNTS